MSTGSSRSPRAAEVELRDALALDPSNAWAKEGLVHTLKARYPDYTLLLRFFFWLRTLPSGMQTGVLVGGVIVTRLLRAVAKANPSIAIVCYALIAPYFGFGLLTGAAAAFTSLTIAAAYKCAPGKYRHRLLGVAAFCAVRGVVSGVVLLPALGAVPLIAQATLRDRPTRDTATSLDTSAVRPPGPWFTGLSLGNGSLDLASDRRVGGARDVFVMGFRGGRAINERLRVGIDLGGWLLQPSDVWDPSQGESVSVFGAFAQLFPLARTPMFVEVGGGAATYTHHAPDDFERHGSGWTLAAGYEFRARERFAIVPSASVSGGHFGGIRNPVLTETGLAYRAWDVRLAGIARFGRRD